MNEVESSQPHKFYLCLGSNIEPGANLGAAIERLRTQGSIEDISNVWESRAVGSSGPNFLNVCVSLLAALDEQELKKTVLLPIEAALGRSRSPDKNAPRTIDIDIMMMDGTPLNPDRWGHPFVILPMAELLPHLVHPTSRRPILEVARDTRAATWIVARPEVRRTLLASPRS